MESQSFSIDKASEQDRPAVLDIVRKISDISNQGLGSPQQHCAWQQGTLKHYEEMLDCGNVWVAREANKIVGCAYLDFQIPCIHDCDAYLGGLYVEAQGIGIGSQLLEARILAASKLDRHRLLAEVTQSNTLLINRMIRRGFTLQGQHPGRNYNQSIFMELVYDLSTHIG